MARVNLLISVGSSSKQMQQTSGSSFLNRTDGDESDVDEVAVVVVFFLLMVCGNWFVATAIDRLALFERWWLCFTVGERGTNGRLRNFLLCVCSEKGFGGSLGPRSWI